jgi:hypothetical protein
MTFLYPTYLRLMRQLVLLVICVNVVIITNRMQVSKPSSNFTVLQFDEIFAGRLITPFAIGAI